MKLFVVVFCAISKEIEYAVRSFNKAQNSSKCEHTECQISIEQTTAQYVDVGKVVRYRCSLLIQSSPKVTVMPPQREKKKPPGLKRDKKAKDQPGKKQKKRRRGRGRRERGKRRNKVQAKLAMSPRKTPSLAGGGLDRVRLHKGEREEKQGLKKGKRKKQKTKGREE